MCVGLSVSLLRGQYFESIVSANIEEIAKKHLTDILMPSYSGVFDRDPSQIDLAGPTVNTGGSSYIDHY